MVQEINPREDIVYFEAVIPSESGCSMFAADAFLQGENLDKFTPPAGRAVQAAKVLQSLGFKVRHIGTFSISAEGPRELWERVFNTRVERRTQNILESHPERGQVSYLSHVADAPFSIPEELNGLVEKAYPQSPPILFEGPSPLPPRVTYHHLRVPDDVAMICRSKPVHHSNVTGKGVLLAMVDSGFYKHPFYLWHDYNYNATLSPDAIRVEKDEVGHGTAEAANIFANAPDIDFIGVKMGNNATLAFKVASDLYPGVMTNSWGYHLPGRTTLPNFLKPLEAAILEAVRQRGITVCFSAGNGHVAFPAMMPDVIAVGGVYAHSTLDGEDFLLEASDYTSSFDSLIYPGRHVPDICGLVGMRPGAIYIMLPVQPEDEIDTDLGGQGYPNKDETATNDGWAVISGTSAASPQVAGVCALLKQVQPGLSPDLTKAILKASGRDVKKGKSGMGEWSGEGYDGATGAGLVDACAAYKLARSVQIRNISHLPSPR